MPYACTRTIARRTTSTPRSPRKRSSAAARVAHTLHTHAYAGLIRPRETSPRNSDLRHESQREPAGHGIVHTHQGAENARIWWRGLRTSTRPSGSDPTKPLVTGLALCSRLGGCPTQSRRNRARVPRNRSRTEFWVFRHECGSSRRNEQGVRLVGQELRRR